MVCAPTVSVVKCERAFGIYLRYHNMASADVSIRSATAVSVSRCMSGVGHRGVIARVFGGLGNQMFIYASARGLAARLRRNLTQIGRASGWERQEPASG